MKPHSRVQCDFPAFRPHRAGTDAAGMPGSSLAANLVTEREASELKWDKAACRFCGTGCGVLVGVKDGKIVATKGDPAAPVNKGLNCIKGYFLAKVLYGKDRLTKPLIRKENKMVEASWEEQRAYLDSAIQALDQPLEIPACPIAIPNSRFEIRN